MIKYLIIGLLLISNAFAFNNDKVVFQTSKGNITFEIFSKEAPIASKNFLTLVKQGYYNGTIFHRVIKGFIIQGGDPTGSGNGGESIYGHPFENEWISRLSFLETGMLAMANSGPNTNTSQFFINTVSTYSLDRQYTIFGHVISGMDVVFKIEDVETENEKPINPVQIENAYVVPATPETNDFYVNSEEGQIGAKDTINPEILRKQLELQLKNPKRYFDYSKAVPKLGD